MGSKMRDKLVLGWFYCILLAVVILLWMITSEFLFKVIGTFFCIAVGIITTIAFKD